MPLSNLPPGGGDVNWISVVMMLFLSLWGGLVNYIGRIKSDIAARFNLVELFGEFAISSFAGITVGLFAIAFDVNPVMTLALTAVAGHAGGRTVYMLDKLFIERFDSLTNKIKKE